jgi:hypothetical protein
VAEQLVWARYVFWDLTPRSQLKVSRHFGRAYRFHLQDRRITQVRNQRETGKKTSVYLKKTARPYVPQDRKLHNHRCENLKS